MNILVGNSAQQKFEEGEDKLRYGLESAEEHGMNVKIIIRIKTYSFIYFSD